MSARDVIALVCAVLAAVLGALFLALVASAAWGRLRWSRRPVVRARVVGHEPGGEQRAEPRRWRTVVAWVDAAGREGRGALEPPPMEPGARWLSAGTEVPVRVDPAGRLRPRRLDEPGQALRSALLVGAIYLLAPAVLCAVVAGLLHR